MYNHLREEEEFHESIFSQLGEYCRNRLASLLYTQAARSYIELGSVHSPVRKPYIHDFLTMGLGKVVHGPDRAGPLHM